MPVNVSERSDQGLFSVIRKCHSDGHKRERKRGLCSGFLLYISFISVYFPRSLFKAPLIQMHLPCKQQKETTLQWRGQPCLTFIRSFAMLMSARTDKMIWLTAVRHIAFMNPALWITWIFLKVQKNFSVRRKRVANCKDEWNRTCRISLNQNTETNKWKVTEDRGQREYIHKK